MTEALHGTIYTQRVESSTEPMSPTMLVVPLQRVQWLPPDATWWFGWCETEITLPGQLDDAAALPTTWDLVQIFSPHCELRRVRRGPGWIHLLLTEQPLPEALHQQWEVAEGNFDAQQTHRILWGNRLRMPTAEGRGVVRFPRPLDYNLPTEQAADPATLEQALVARVWHYLDQQQRLRMVRYSELTHCPVGALRPPREE